MTVPCTEPCTGEELSQQGGTQEFPSPSPSLGCTSLGSPRSPTRQDSTQRVGTPHSGMGPLGRSCWNRGIGGSTGKQTTRRHSPFLEHSSLKYLLSGKHMAQTNAVELNISCFMPLLRGFFPLKFNHQHMEPAWRMRRCFCCEQTCGVCVGQSSVTHSSDGLGLGLVLLPPTPHSPEPHTQDWGAAVPRAHSPHFQTFQRLAGWPQATTACQGVVPTLNASSHHSAPAWFAACPGTGLTGILRSS